MNNELGDVFVVMGRCGTCKFRNNYGYCENSHLAEDASQSDKSDMLIYPYSEGGGFFVGPKFGCVHHETKDKTDLDKGKEMLPKKSEQLMFISEKLKAFIETHHAAQMAKLELRNAVMDLGEEAPDFLVFGDKVVEFDGDYCPTMSVLPTIVDLTNKE